MKRQVVTKAPPKTGASHDLIKLLDSMQALREQQRISKLDSIKLDDYLVAAGELGAYLEQYEGSDFKKIATAIAGNANLRFYDADRDLAWRVIEPEMLELLDGIIVKAMGDDFRGLEDKHHFMNAAKCVMCKDWELEKRIEVYDTVLPVVDSSQALNIANNIGQISGDTLKINLDAKDLDTRIKQAKDAGFSKVVIRFDYTKDKEKIIKLKRIYNGTITDVAQPSGPNKNTIFKNRLLGVPAFLLVGGLPASLQKRIQNAFTMRGYSSFNSESTTAANALLEGAASFSLGFWALHLGPIVYVPLFAYFGLAAIPRIASLMKNSDIAVKDKNVFGKAKARPIGSLIAKIPLYPAEQILNLACGKVNYYPKEYTINFNQATPLGAFDNRFMRLARAQATTAAQKALPEKPQLKIPPAPNYHPLMDKAALIAVNAEAEESLRYRVTAHHSQGNLFRDAMNPKGLEGFGRYLDKPRNSLTFFSTSEQQPYRKFSALVCFSGERYSITLIGKNQIAAQAISEKLSDGKKPLDARLKEIAELAEADYAHLTYYKQGQKAEDLICRGVAA